MNAPTPATTLPEIHSAIEQVKNQLQCLPAPSLAAIEGQIQYHAARAITGDDAPRHKAALDTALIAKKDAELVLEQRDRLTKELQQLQITLALEEAEQRRLEYAAQQRHKDELLNEFQRCALAMVRAARKCMNANIPTGDFSIGFLSSDPNGGFSLLQEMRYGLLRFERREKEQQEKQNG